MSTILTIPKLEMSMTEGTLAQWVAPNGSFVKEGDTIYLLETDKTSREIEAPVAGNLIHRAVEGEAYPCGTEIGEIV